MRHETKRRAAVSRIEQAVKRRVGPSTTPVYQALAPVVTWTLAIAALLPVQAAPAQSPAAAEAPMAAAAAANPAARAGAAADAKPSSDAGAGAGAGAPPGDTLANAEFASASAPAIEPRTRPQRLAAVPLADLSLEALRDVIVTSVARREQPLLDAPTSIYVISGEDIRRSGATTLPEALRLAPNLQVAAIDARQYAVSARGFNGNIANKLLVMVDGRTLYSPLFSGVFWDAQDFVADEIDRIEVISGPAGVAWGTNAVNGVINVVTRDASRLQGAAVSATVGSLEATVVGRQSFRLDDDATLRAHVRSFRRDSSQLRGGGEIGDASRGSAAGLRADWARGSHTLSVHAGIYNGRTDERPGVGAVTLGGSNLTARWSSALSETRNIDVQAYVDNTRRSDRYLLQEDARSVDLEGKLRQVVGRHRWLVGAGYRQASDSSEPGLIFAFFPARQKQRWLSAFLQDEISPAPELTVTLGLRGERNPYTGWEPLPSVRAAWKLGPESTLWASWSRAVRSPARFDREIFVPTNPPFFLAGGPDFKSEVARVIEAGFRTQWAATASLSMTAFLHEHARLRSTRGAGPGGAGAYVFANRAEGRISGLEAWGQWRPTPAWRLDAGLLLLEQRLRLQAGSDDPVGTSALGNDARRQAQLRSTYNLAEPLELTLAVRHLSSLPFPRIPRYTATDMTLRWRAGSDLDLGLGVRDAFNRDHEEYQGFASISRFPRSAFVAATFKLR